MGIYRIPLVKDTFITQESVSGNGGYDAVLNVAAKWVAATGCKQVSRILGAIDTSSTSELVTNINSGYIPDPNVYSTVTATLYMYNTEHSEWRSRGFNLNLHPIIEAWDEGNGVGYNESNLLNTSGYANYVMRKSGSTWTNSGGTYAVNSTSATQYFVESENLTATVTNLVKLWLAGTTSNNGFIIKMADNEESTTSSLSASTDFTRKSFFARHTNTLLWPRIEFTWDDTIQDFRNILSFTNTGYLFFRNIVNNAYTDLSGTAGIFPGKIFIEGATSNSSTSWTTLDSTLSSLTASRFSKGMYRTYLPAIPVTAYSTYTNFRDKWQITSSLSAIYTTVTSSLSILNPVNSSYYNTEWYNINVFFRNLKSQYVKENKANLRLFIKDLGESLTVLTASSTSYNNVTVQDGYWRISTAQGETDIPWQSLNFDKNGNFIILDMNNLTRNIDYKIDLKFPYKGQDVYIDGNSIASTFRVI